MAAARPNTYAASSSGSIVAGKPRPFALSGKCAEYGDSLMSFAYQADGGRWAMALTGRHPQVVENYGVPSDTLQLMLDRQAAAIAEMLSLGVTVVFLRAGTNGPGGGDFATKYATLVNNFVAAGLFVFCLQVPPKTGSDYSSYKGIIQGICAANPLTTRWVQDCDAMADSSYQPLAGTTLDGIHMSPTGQFLIGSQQGPIIAPYFLTDPRVVNSTQAAAQWVVNPLMTGTGGSLVGGTGVVPNSWTVSAVGVGATFVASIEAADPIDPVQVPWLRINFTAAGASGNSWEITADLAHGAISTDLAAIRSIDTVLQCQLVALDTTNMGSIEVGPSSARVYIQQARRLQLKGNGVLTRELTLRSSHKRSATAYSANALKLMLNVISGGAFASSVGSIRIRCASAVGIAA